MRIIAGKHKGRRIELSKEASHTVRPTSDFARQAIFNILTHGAHGLNGHTFDGRHVLDIFCGTGAFGLEALSRGAASVLFIDQSRNAVANAKMNVEKIYETESAQFLLADATQLPKARRAYSLVFLDPPYFSNLIAPTIKSLASGGWLTEDAVIVVEHDEKETIELPQGFESRDRRKYGRAVVEIITAETVSA
jgi:16S rRNA (guanine966-N2)-methyltransferase